MPDWTPDLDYGVIIKTRLGPRGDYKPQRPAVVLVPNAQIRKFGGLIIVGGSTESLDPTIEVELPSGAVGAPHPLTGLCEPTFISGDWQRIITVTQVQDVCGQVPDAYMEKIEAKLRGEPTRD
jgi:mRNA-degrading endonuclease toxin of MazEF toxin-antitoxin module